MPPIIHRDLKKLQMSLEVVTSCSWQRKMPFCKQLRLNNCIANNRHKRKIDPYAHSNYNSSDEFWEVPCDEICLNMQLELELGAM